MITLDTIVGTVDRTRDFDRYLARERYRLIRAHDWDEEIIARIRDAR